MILKICRIVQDVGALLLTWRELKILDAVWDGPQCKSTVDKMAHEELVKRLNEISTEIPIISEEDQTSLVKQRPSRYWLIDPIDGTASFIGGYEGFVTQIALIENDIPSMTAIYAPAIKSLYSAQKGCGALHNGKVLKIQTNNEIQVLIDNYPEPRGIARNIFNGLNIVKYIECGSIALKICRIADGTADIFFKNVEVKDWDIAAPQLIIEEAGGILRNGDGEKITYRGDYKQNGIIATVSEDAYIHFLNWYTDFKRRHYNECTDCSCAPR
jgi:3'(2'), 5'-bisphosphate nucleotidase